MEVYLFNLKTELATWGGLGVGASVGQHASHSASAHIDFCVLAHHGKPGGGWGGGRVLIKKHVKSM